MRNILALIGLITVFEIAEPPVKRAYYWVSHNATHLLDSTQAKARAQK